MTRLATSKNPTSDQKPSWSLASVTREVRQLPNRTVIHGIPGSGKTSLPCHAPSPVFLMTRDETGLLALLSAGLVPQVDYFPQCFEGWNHLRSAVKELATQPHDYKNLVLDTLNGAERLCHEHVCEQPPYKGDWGYFDSYQQAGKNALQEWITFTSLLEKCRMKGMGVILLCHSQVVTFKNPEGTDFDRWQPALRKESWAHAYGWCDQCFFLNFKVTVKEERGRSKGKATGGQERVLCTERTPSYDAKNRSHLPGEIECGASAEEAWTNLIQAMKGA